MIDDHWAKFLDGQGQVDTFIWILKKLLIIDGKTLRCVNAFLCFRQQWVVDNGVKSDFAPFVSGVPQGRFLVSLLFQFVQ